MSSTISPAVPLDPGHRGPARPASYLVIAPVVAVEIALTSLLVHAPAEVALTAVVLLGGTALVAACLFVLPESERQPLLVLVLAGVLLRVAVMLILHGQLVAPANPGGFMYPDSFGYDRVGWNVAEHWRAGCEPRIEYQTASYSIGYHYTVGLVYLVAGHAPLVVKALNVILSVGLIPLTFVLGRRLGGPRVGLIAAILMTIFPQIIVFSTQILKDIAITFLLLVSTLGWVAFARRPRPIHLVIAVLPATPLIALRAYMFLFWAVAVAIGLIVWSVRERRPAVALVLASAIAAAGIWTAIRYSALRFLSVDLMIASLSAVGVARGSLFEGVYYRSLTDVILFYPIGFLRFLLTPLPWRVELPTLAEGLGSVIRYALLPFVAFGVAELWRRRRLQVLPILVTALLAISLFAVAFRGGGPRHMTQLYPYFFVLAAVGLPRFPHWPLPMALGVGAFLIAAVVVSPG